MIPLSQQRAADRRRIEGLIAAQPAAARFRTLALQVRLLGEPEKTRALRAGGFDLAYTAQVLLALPPGTPPPEPERDLIDVEDFSGRTQTYALASSTALLGEGCFRLGLRVRNARPARGAAPGA
jgi:hypothetical protein